MSLNRREFHGFVGAAFTALLAKPSFAGDLANLPFERIALNRLTFGATQADETRLRKLGLDAWLDAELAKPVQDAALSNMLADAQLTIEYEDDKDENGHVWKGLKENRSYVNLNRPSAELLALIDYENGGMSYEERIRPAREVQAASLIRAVHADAQLREVMTQFWHDHFNVNSMKDERTAAFFAVYDGILRSHALGNFRELLGEVTRSAAMLFYLNNESSKASPANENFARELFELHTLGAENYANAKYDHWGDVPGAKQGMADAYIDEDVYEAARALTGWSFGDGRWLSDSENAPETGEFHYFDQWHDPYQKRVLGVEFAPNNGPMEDGEKLLDLVANHPGTARFVCRKIARRLLADEPEQELVDGAAAVFLDAKNDKQQLSKVVRHIVLSSSFRETKPQKLRRPFEFLAAFIRMNGATVQSTSLDFHWSLSQCGWTQHECRPPTGHSDANVHWANTNYLSGLTGIALSVFEDWANIAPFKPANAVSGAITDLAGAGAELMQRLVSAQTALALGKDLAVAIAGDEKAQLPTDADERNGQLRTMLAMAAFHPEFLYR